MRRLFLLLGLLWALTACGELTSATVESFTAEPAIVVKGESVTLTWSGASEDASLSLEPDIGDVTSQTSVTVTPAETTLYTLTATSTAGSNSYEVTVTVTLGEDATPEPDNQTPTAQDASLETDEDTALSLQLVGSDPEGAALLYSIVKKPEHGSLSDLDETTGKLTYTPEPNYVGEDSFTYRVSDGGLESEVATVTLTVKAVNDPPVLNITTPEGDAVLNADEMWTLSAAVTDVEDGDLSSTVTWMSDLDGDLGTGTTLSFTLSQGVHTLTASVSDAEGETATEKLRVVAQRWSQQFGSANWDAVNSAAVSPNGDVYVVGSTHGALPGYTHAGERDAFVAKYDASGTLVWLEQFGTDGDDGVFGIDLDGDSLYVTGFIGGVGIYDAMVAEYKTDGTRVWLKQLDTAGDDAASALIGDGDGGYYLIGDTTGSFAGFTNAGGYDLFVAKLDGQGEQLWVEQFGTSEDDTIMAATPGPDGDLYLTGYTRGSFDGSPASGKRTGFLIRLDESGERRWTEQFAVADEAYAYDVAAAPDGGAYVVGQSIVTTSPDGSDTFKVDIFVAKFDSSGVPLWQKQLDGNGILEEKASSVATDPEGNAYVSGTTRGTLGAGGNLGGYDALLMKYTPDGKQLWLKQFGTSGHDYGSAAALGPDNSLFVAGSTGGDVAGSNAGKGDVFLSKFDLNGEQP